MPRLSAVLAIAVFAWGASAEYVLVDDYAPRTFFNKFDFFTEGDPTGGTVRYQSRENAERLGLITTTEESSIIDVDYENVSPNGRAAVRLESKTSYQKGLLVVDVKHMPGGICGVWPALWTLGSGTWPNHGEIDIIEGVNIQKQNLMTLHTSSGCTIDGQNSYSGGGGGITNTPGTNFKPSGVRFTGNLTTANCDVKAPGQSANMGCQFEAPQNPRKLTPRYDEDEEEDEDSDSSDAVYAPTYGPAFNKNGGGIFAMEWTTDGIKIFFFPHKRRQDLHPMLRTAFAPTPNQTSLYAKSNAAPAVYGKGALKLPSTDDSRWGDPQAHFKGSGCDFERHFQMHRIVLNTDFCGEWAGQPHIWQEGCAAKTGSSTCQEYVINNPEAFKEAYWEIRSMRWYQWNGGEDGSIADSDEVSKMQMEKRETELQGMDDSISMTTVPVRTSTTFTANAAPTPVFSNSIMDFTEIHTGSCDYDDDKETNTGYYDNDDDDNNKETNTSYYGNDDDDDDDTKINTSYYDNEDATAIPAAQLARRTEAPEPAKTNAGASANVALSAVVALAGLTGFVGAVL